MAVNVLRYVVSETGLRFNAWKVIWMKRHECQYAIKECKCINMRNSYSTVCANLCCLKNNHIFLTSSMAQLELCALHKDIIILCIFLYGQSFALSVRMNEVTGDVACCTRADVGILSTQENNLQTTCLYRSDCMQFEGVGLRCCQQTLLR